MRALHLKGFGLQGTVVFGLEARFLTKSPSTLCRSAGWYGTGSREQVRGMDGLHERLEALASRLGDVDERSMRLQGECG